MTWMALRPLILLSLAGVLACAPMPPVGVALVVRRPPPDRIEEMGAQPGASFIWVGGYWVWGRNDYRWNPGRWLLPPAGFRIWTPGHWVDSRRGWYWVEGRWH